MTVYDFLFAFAVEVGKLLSDGQWPLVPII